MCLVLDPSVFSAVFNSKDRNHIEFQPVNKWITEKSGFLVYGGTKYKKELKNCPRYYGIFNELRKKGKVKIVNHTMVDDHQAKVNALLSSGDICNDTHIIAIFRVSRCRLFCSKDAKADKYITNSNLYLRNQKPPKIYRYKKHCKQLLCAHYIVLIKNLA